MKGQNSQRLHGNTCESKGCRLKLFTHAFTVGKGDLINTEKKQIKQRKGIAFIPTPSGYCSHLWTQALGSRPNKDKDGSQWPRVLFA